MLVVSPLDYTMRLPLKGFSFCKNCIPIYSAKTADPPCHLDTVVLSHFLECLEAIIRLKQLTSRWLLVNYDVFTLR